jgi:hypothetical protein
VQRFEPFGQHLNAYDVILIVVDVHVAASDALAKKSSFVFEAEAKDTGSVIKYNSHVSGLVIVDHNVQRGVQISFPR